MEVQNGWPKKRKQPRRKQEMTHASDNSQLFDSLQQFHLFLLTHPFLIIETPRKLLPCSTWLSKNAGLV